MQRTQDIQSKQVQVKGTGVARQKTCRDQEKEEVSGSQLVPK